MNKIRGAQAGFTLIELVVVIVILGILAATALPKFVDLSSEAGTAASNGVAGAIASGSATNYAAKVAGKTTGVTTLGGDNATTCTTANMTALVSGVTFVTGTPANGKEFKVAAGTGTCASKAGEAVTCKITGYKGDEVDATVICTG